MPKTHFPFSPPSFSEDIVDSVSRVLKSGWVGTGPAVKEFEASFRDHLGVGHCVAVSSCTSGLFLGMTALGIGAGQEVIAPNMTFVSTINSIIHCGATPVLVDIEAAGKTISVERVEAAITPRTSAILAVHYAGMPCDLTALRHLADKHNLFLIEDCAHAVETQFNGFPAGTIGDFAAFSFYATKNVAIGEGGMVSCKTEALAHKIAGLSLHGLSRGAWARFSNSGKRTYEVDSIGYKANMTDLQAVIGLRQLEALERNYKRREEIWDYYSVELADLDLELPQRELSEGSKHALHLYSVSLPSQINRDAWVQTMSDDEGVAFGIHYNAVSSFQIYEEFANFDRAELQASENWGKRCVSLSLSPGMTAEHVERVVEVIRGSLS